MMARRMREIPTNFCHVTLSCKRRIPHVVENNTDALLRTFPKLALIPLKLE
jgi:phage terminase Nu1 subunit (DNA packaging protein)